MWTKKLYKIGASAFALVPRAVLDDWGIDERSMVECELTEGGYVIRPKVKGKAKPQGKERPSGKAEGVYSRSLHWIGKSSLGVTLPTEFCKRHGLEKAETVMVEDAGEYLIIKKPGASVQATRADAPDKEEEYPIL